MFFFAYDGSNNGDWISHYAVQLAAAHEDRSLHLLHVRESARDQADVERKVARLRAECARLCVELIPHMLPGEDSVLRAICSAVPRGPAHYLLCGTRGRARPRGFLGGTISEWLLRRPPCNVLAVRVFQPGLLGLPRRLLLPVAGHPRGFRSGLPFLRLFGPQVSHLQILLIAPVSRWRFRRMTPESAELRRLPGQAYCRRVEREIGEQLGLGDKVMDAQVVVSDDIAQEIVLAANRTRSRLIYLGASERNLRERFLQGNPIEQVLRSASCDVAVYRGID